MSRLRAHLMMALAMIVALGCQEEYTPPGVPEAYQWLYDMSFDLAGSDAGRLELPFRTIALERTECEGTCPIDRVEFHSDGRATYVGEAFVVRTGTFSGKVYLRAFGQLSLMVERAGVTEMDDRYDAPMTDGPTIILTITPETGPEKRIEDNSGFGPPELWGVEHAILGLMEEISWIPETGDDPG